MLSLGRSRAIASGSQLQARIDELARREQKMVEQGRRPPEEREQHLQHFRGQVEIMERVFKGAVRELIIEDSLGRGGCDFVTY